MRPFTLAALILVLCSSCFAEQIEKVTNLDGTYFLFDRSKPAGFQFVGEYVNKHLRYTMERPVKNNAKITVYSGSRKYVLYDLPIVVNGRIEAQSGETQHTYRFHLSPDECWLFVERDGWNRFCGGLLYHRRRASDKVMSPVLPFGLRLDEVAVRQRAVEKQLPFHKLRRGTRNVQFVQWDLVHDRLVFSVYAASTFEDKEYRREGKPFLSDGWTVAYSLKKKRFNTIEED